jgi:hypothetical protein
VVKHSPFSRKENIVSYLPSKEAELKVFVQNFAALIVAVPATYGLVANDGTAIDAAVQAYADAFDAAQNPATRTAAALVTKNAAKSTVIAIVRGYAMMIKTNRAVMDEAKTNLGIGVYDFQRTAVPAPISFPVLKLMGATPLRHELRWNDSGAPDSKARPAGVVGLQLFCQVGDTPGGSPGAPPNDPLASRFRCFTTKQPYRMELAAADEGKKAFYYARWQTATGLTGPFSQVVSMTVAG